MLLRPLFAGSLGVLTSRSSQYHVCLNMVIEFTYLRETWSQLFSVWCCMTIWTYYMVSHYIHLAHLFNYTCSKTCQEWSLIKGTSFLLKLVKCSDLSFQLRERTVIKSEDLQCTVILQLQTKGGKWTLSLLKLNIREIIEFNSKD